MRLLIISYDDESRHVGLGGEREALFLILVLKSYKGGNGIVVCKQ